jgi:SPP1 family predicted phage head-tail adaptor
MKIGRLDTPVRFEKQVEVPNTEFGGSDVTWVTHWECFAEVMDITTRQQESTLSDLRQMKRPCKVTFRYNDTIDSTMRVVVLDRQNRILQIVSKPAEIGRKEGMEMMCHDYSV